MKYIYILTCKDYDWYKIGITKNPRARYLEIQNGVPFNIHPVICLQVEGAEFLEKKLQAVFDSKRTNGEWFLLERPDLELALEMIKSSKELNQLPMHQSDASQVIIGEFSTDLDVVLSALRNYLKLYPGATDVGIGTLISSDAKLKKLRRVGLRSQIEKAVEEGISKKVIESVQGYRFSTITVASESRAV